ncbi:MAG: ABC transporter substrate-binding protein [Pseudomonadota bacterium]
MRRVSFIFLLVVGLLSLFAMPLWAEDGVTDDEIVIGSHQDLSGPIAGWGVQVKMGLELRAKEINDAGGIHGRKIRLVVEDNGYDPKKAIMVANKMINRDKVFCFIGNMGSPTAGATKPIISKKKIPQMFPLTAASLFFEPYDRYSFGGWTPYYDQARTIVKYFHEVKGYDRVALLYQDDEMGAIMMKGVEDQLAVYNLKMAGAESYKRGATEFSSQMAKLRKVEPQLVVLATVIRETVGALKEANKIGWKVDMAGMSPSYTSYVPGLCLKAGFSPDGYYATGQSPYIYPDSEFESIREFCKRHQAMFQKDPDLPTSAGYGALDFFRLAAEKVGRDLTREKFIDALETFDAVPDAFFHGAPITFSPQTHQGAFGVVLSQVQNGKFVKVADIPSYK